MNFFYVVLWQKFSYSMAIYILERKLFRKSRYVFTYNVIEILKENNAKQFNVTVFRCFRIVFDTVVVERLSSLKL
jgi:hypothetical protein